MKRNIKKNMKKNPYREKSPNRFCALLANEWFRCYHSLRFRISLIAVLCVFVIGTVSFVGQWKEQQTEYAQRQEKVKLEEEKRAESLTMVALASRRFGMEPRLSALMDDCEGAVLPTHLTYTAYGVWDFYVQHNLTNPLLERDASISWAFVVTLFLSFIALLLTYDAVCGEKRVGVLAFSLSYPVSRFAFLMAKFVSVVGAVGGMLLCGVLVSLLLCSCLGVAPFGSGGMWAMEVGGFLLFSWLFIALFAALGLLASVLTSRVIVSALTCVFFWLLFLVLIPNSAIFVASRFFPLSRTAEEMEQESQQLEKKFIDEAPTSSWGNRGDEPFFPGHQFRAELYQRICDMEQNQFHSYSNEQFRQYESTRWWLLLSPLAQYKRMNEIWLDGGYQRFRKNWEALHCFQQEFLAWFKAQDAQDPESPHWYNPYESYSTSDKSVTVAEIPFYEEPVVSFSERLLAVWGYVFAMLVTVGLLLALSYLLFRRYDVR